MKTFYKEWDFFLKFFGGPADKINIITVRGDCTVISFQIAPSVCDLRGLHLFSQLLSVSEVIPYAIFSIFIDNKQIPFYFFKT